MSDECCDALETPLEVDERFINNKRQNGNKWVPAFVQYVDREKCTGCGMCAKVCLSECYEIQEINGKKVSVVINRESCMGDCHCHKVCPVEGGAMVCKPKALDV